MTKPSFAVVSPYQVGALIHCCISSFGLRLRCIISPQNRDHALSLANGQNKLFRRL
jgi:hypothetical protein